MSKMDDLEKQLIGEPEKKKGDSSLVTFFVGIICLAIGLFIVFQSTDVGFSWYSFALGGFRIPTGVIVIPLFIGIILLFYNSKSIVSWLVTIIGVALILITIIMSVNIIFRRTSLFFFILMFGFILAGIGLLLKSLLFKPKDK